MADNTTLPVGVGGDTIRTIQRGQTKTQVIQLDIGGEAGPESLVVSNNPLPVVPVGTTAVTGSVAVTNFPAVQAVSGTVAISNTIAGIPQTGSATSAGSLPVVIASDQVVPVQFQPDQLGPAGMDTSLPVTIALDQVVPVQVAPTGQQTVQQSLSVALASDQSALPVVGTFWPPTQPVSIIGTPTINAGVPPLGIASSTGALPVVVASDQVVPVQLNPDTFGLNTADAALPVTLAIDQPPISVQVTPTGQQSMMSSQSVTLALDQPSIVVTANQGVSPYMVAGSVSVSNFPASQKINGSVSISGATGLALPTNAAQETGGNLATLVGLETQLQRLIEINLLILATLKADNLLLQAMSGQSVGPSNMLDDATL